MLEKIIDFYVALFCLSRMSVGLTDSTRSYDTKDLSTKIMSLAIAKVFVTAAECHFLHI